MRGPNPTEPDEYTGSYTGKTYDRLIQVSDSIHKLQEKLQQLQSEISDISKSKTVAKDQLKGLHDEIEAAQEKLKLVNKTFEVKYEELKEACSQAQKLQNYVEQFEDSQDYQELESIIQCEVGKTLSSNKKLMQIALFSVLLALRNDPDRYFIVDRMELTPFTTTTITNYNSFQESRRPSYLQGSKQFSQRVLESAEKILCNLQKVIVDSTISSAAGLEEGDSYPAAYQALPYYESPSQLPVSGRRYGTFSSFLSTSFMNGAYTLTSYLRCYRCSGTPAKKTSS
jgi:hypothetical protein